MPVTRRCLLGMAATGIAPLAARARQQYPSGLNVKIIVPFAPGGSIDVIGRIIADRLTVLWNLPVVVENVPGAAGDIGYYRVARGPADGTQFLLISTPFITNQFLRPHLKYDPERELIPISCVALLPNLLVVR